VGATGTKALVEAMRGAGCQRIVTVSGAGASTVPTPSRPNPPRREPGAGWFNHYFATPLARRVIGQAMVDVAIMEDVLRASDLEWTSVRPPYLTNGPVTGRYRTAEERNVRRGFRLSRADAAHFMLTALDQPATVGKALAVAY
jgi:putative NADH-flavin reductase